MKYVHGGMTSGEAKLHGAGKPASADGFNGHRCEKRNMCENMTGYVFDENGVGTRGTKPKAKARPKNYIG